MIALLLLGGLVGLTIGAEGMIRGAVALARRLGLSPLLIGMTVVSVGTSMPELVVSLRATLAGQPDIATGNVVGSNIANILLILGVAVVIRPIATHPAVVFRDGSAMLAAALALVLVTMVAGAVDRIAGGAFLLALAGYLAFAYRSEIRGAAPSAQLHAAEADQVRPLPGGLPVALLLIVAGTGGLVLGADLFVRGAVALARAYGISEAVIGLGLVAVGTSLPELAATALASLRRQGDVAVGNILGSNLFNSLGILGLAGLVAPLPVTGRIAELDLWIMLAISAALLVLLRTGWRLGRREGALLLIAYGAYVATLIPGAV